MFKTILKIIPQLETSTLNGLENALNSRFARVAKRFASGLKSAILGGGIAALGLSVIDKLINPLKAVNENINGIFERAKDLADEAKQFGTTSGTLLKLQTIGKSSGVGPEELATLLAKFQAALTQAKANPGQPSTLSQFTGEKDTADAFFKFLQGLQSAGQLNRELAEQEVFGERKVLSVAKFLDTNLNAKLAAVTGINSGSATANISNANRVGDLDRTKQAIIDAKGFVKQSGSLSNEIANARAREAQRAEDLQTKQLQSYASLEHISDAADQITTGLQTMLLKMGDMISKVVNLSKAVESISKSRIFRLIGKKLGLGD